MHILKTILFLFLGSILLVSCSQKLSPFTEKVYDDFNQSESVLSKVQFYLSSDIVLYRDFGASESKIENGSIKMINGRKVEEVVFRKGTPGVYLFSPKQNQVAISFENNDENYLMFGTNPKAGGRFVLLAKEWKRRNGKVTYSGQTWNTTSESSYANLLVDIDRARNTQYKKKTVRGRKIN